MRGWVVSDEGHRWSVKLDVRDLGGHLDTTFMVGPLPWLLGCALSLFGWFLSMLSRWTFMGYSGFSGPCLFQVLYMASFLAGASMRKLKAAILGLFGLVGSLLPVLVLFLACLMDL